MAIEIAPRRRIKAPIWTIILGFFCIILVLALLSSYFYLDKFIKQITQEIQEKEKALVVTPSEKALENELLSVGQKIDDFGKLLSKHGKPSNVFNFLESLCLPKIWFSDFNFTSEKNEVAVSGQTDSFVTLEHQVSVLSQDPLLKKPIKLSGVSIDEEGKVNFTLLLTFDPQLFK